MRPRVTLLDVAEHAGVSRATASLVLNDSPLVAHATRERVKDAMSELGYVYDRAAASLRRSRTNAIGLILTEFTHPYLAHFATSVQAELEKHDIIVLSGASHEDATQQSRLARALVERRVDGLIVIPAHDSRAEDFAALAGTPLILLARHITDMDADYVGADNVNGAAAAVRHLVEEHGRSRFAFVGGLETLSPFRDRVAGIRTQLAQYGLQLPESAIIPAPMDRKTIRHRAADLLRGYDAVIAFNDIVALGLQDGAFDLGIAVGNDVSIIGFDDITDGEFARPALTTLSSPGALAGREAAQLLLARTRGDDSPPRHITLESTLVIRESCGCSPSPRKVNRHA